VHQSSPNWVVGKGSYHLQLIKFWPSRAPGKRVCGGAKIFGSAFLQSTRSVLRRLWAFFSYAELTTQLNSTGHVTLTANVTKNGRKARAYKYPLLINNSLAKRKFSNIQVKSMLM